MPTLAATVKKLRKRAKLSQFELAVQSEVALGTIRLIEQGTTTDPKASTAIALAKVFGVTLEELLGVDLKERPRAVKARRPVRIIRTG